MNWPLFICWILSVAITATVAYFNGRRHGRLLEYREWIQRKKEDQ